MKRIPFVRQLTYAWMALALLAGCAATPQNPAQAVYAATGTYTVALTAAVNYKRLPPCTKAQPPCSKPEAVAQLQRADDVAYAALTAAQNIVRNTSASASAVDLALFNANQAVGAFASIAKTLGAP